MPRLVVGRKAFEKIVIMGSDGPIVITVIPCRQKLCRVSVEAPANVAIYREELFQKIAGKSDGIAARAEKARSIPGG